MDTLKNIEIISKIGQKITSTLNLAEVIGSLYDSIKTIMDASGLVIYIFDPDRNGLELKYQFGRQKNVSGFIPFDNESSFCMHSMKNKSEIFINDVREEYSKYIPSYYWASAPDEEIVHSFINIPLIMHGEAFGVISVQSFKKNSYTKEHFEILKSLAAYMSISFNNAETYSQLNSAKESLLKQKKIIEDKNKDILDSIHYAKRIQTSLLPTDKYIGRILNNMNKGTGV